jgi:hypothetical protein
MVNRKFVSSVQNKDYSFDNENKRRALVHRLREEQVTKTGRRLYSNIYHPSFSNIKHYKKIVNSLSKTKQKEIFNFTQGEINYKQIINKSKEDAPYMTSETATTRTKNTRSNTADALHPFFEYFYSGTKLIKQGAKKDRMLAERRKDVSFIANLYSGNAMKNQVRQRHPSMFKDRKQFMGANNTQFEASNITKINDPRSMNKTGGFEIIEGPLVLEEPLRIDNKMRPFSNETMSMNPSPNLQKQKHEHSKMMKQYQDNTKINISEDIDSSMRKSSVLERIHLNKPNGNLANRPIDILYIEVSKNMTRDLNDRTGKFI